MASCVSEFGMKSRSMDFGVSVRFEGRVANGMTWTAFSCRSFRRRPVVRLVIQALVFLGRFV